MTDPQENARALDKQARQLESLDRLSQRFGASLSGALAGGTSSGKQLSGVLDQVGSSLSSALGRNLSSLAGSAVTDLFQGAARSLSADLSVMSFGGFSPFAKGGVFAGGAVQPFAGGGVVSAPTYFPMRGGGLGLMGERGSEAIMPLARGADGRLGVRSAGGGGAPTNVSVVIQARDAESFKRSEAQVSASLARAVARGRRGL